MNVLHIYLWFESNLRGTLNIGYKQVSVDSQTLCYPGAPPAKLYSLIAVFRALNRDRPCSNKYSPIRSSQLKRMTKILASFDMQLFFFSVNEGKATHREHTQGVFYPNTKHLWDLEIFNFVENWVHMFIYYC